MLHTVNKSPFASSALDSCLRLISAGSTLLLIEDGVYAALENTPYGRVLTNLADDIRLCVLDADLQARGLSGQSLVQGMEVIDYDGFVQLSIEQQQVLAW